MQAIGSWARYLGLGPGLGTLATSNPEIHAVGSWARYLGLGTLAYVPWRRAILDYNLLAAELRYGDEQSWITKLRYPGLSTLATTNPDIQAIGNWARYLGLGTMA